MSEIVSSESSKNLSLNRIELRLSQPSAELLSWRAAAAHLLTRLLADANRTAQAATSDTISSLTRARLHKVADALAFNHRQLLSLFKPLLEHASLPASFNVASGQLTSSSGLLESNFANVFRDWAWPQSGDSTETESHLSAILALLPQRKLRKVLILGAGSARLAYDLACEIECDEILATEINPLLFLIAKEIIDGRSMDLFEVAELPLASDQPVKKHRLGAPSSKTQKSKLKLIFNDFLEDTLTANEFDLVITPWFLDVVGLPFEMTSSKVNRLLPVGGHWINLGPLMFATSERAELLTNDEVEAALLKPESGYKFETSQRLSLTQLKSPLSATYRTDEVFGWRAQKTAETRPQSVKTEARRPNSRLDFLENPTRPIRLHEALPGLDLEEASQSHALISEVLAACHEQKSVRQIAQKLAPDFGLPPEDIEPVVFGVLTNFIRSHS